MMFLQFDDECKLVQSYPGCHILGCHLLLQKFNFSAGTIFFFHSIDYSTCIFWGCMCYWTLKYFEPQKFVLRAVFDVQCNLVEKNFKNDENVGNSNKLGQERRERKCWCCVSKFLADESVVIKHKLDAVQVN